MREPCAALFVAVCLSLIAAAFVLGNSGSASPPEPPPRSAAPPPLRHLRVPRNRPASIRSARRFLGAFLRYEVGDTAAPITRLLRATATSAFAAELLHTPLRPSNAAQPEPATLGPLSIAAVATDPPVVSISAVAHRPGGPEQLSFVFTRVHGRWLASAPGE